MNFRILPGDSVAGVVTHVRRTIGDRAVRVRAMDGFGSEPSPVSRTDDATFRLLERNIRQFAPDAVVAPYLVVGGADARHFHAISEHVYRFMPVRVTQDDLDRIHGTDERISVRDYEAAIRFYRQLLLNTTGIVTAVSRRDAEAQRRGRGARGEDDARPLFADRSLDLPLRSPAVLSLRLRVSA